MTNWRTSLFGTLTLLAAFVTQFPQLLDPLLDPELAKKIAAGCALVTGFLTFANSKDRQVAGNGTDAAPHIVATGDGTAKFLTVLLALGMLASTAACVVIALMLAGCTTPAGLRDWSKTGRILIRDGIEDYKAVKPLLTDASDPRPVLDWSHHDDTAPGPNPEDAMIEAFNAWQGRQDHRDSLKPQRKLYGISQPQR